MSEARARSGTGAYQDTKLVYDPEETMSYGSWYCPECGSSFYGGGRAGHNSGCTHTGYERMEFHFGLKFVEKVKERAEMFGPDHDWCGVSLRMLQEQFPEQGSAE